ncbi:hypothetical protein [Geoglobus acetivorans]|uniref:Uncharacterized protein n=1 Tax=Geoglobus acetivorans TaxID=565033 RepID=A0A0A7GGL1_GEOAI|nr:hypothetical protein GACE_1038 [Geoglobus acetivorans]
MRWIIGGAGIVLMAVKYIQTGDYMPTIILTGLLVMYEILSRIGRLEVVKVPVAFAAAYYFFSQSGEYLVTGSDNFTILFSAGLALTAFPARYRWGAYLSPAGIALIAASLLFIPESVPLYRYRVMLSAITGFLAITSVLSLFSEKFEFLVSQRFAIGFIAGLAGIYYTELRPILAPGLKSLGDWLIVAGAIYYLAGKLRFEIEEEVENQERMDFETLAERAEKEYLENGDPLPLAVLISHTFGKAGVSPLKAEQVLRDLIPPEKMPKYAFGFEKAIIQSRNKKRRLKKLESIKNKMKEAGGEYGD